MADDFEKNFRPVSDAELREAAQHRPSSEQVDAFLRGIEAFSEKCKTQSVEDLLALAGKMQTPEERAERAAQREAMAAQLRKEFREEEAESLGIWGQLLSAFRSPALGWGAAVVAVFVVLLRVGQPATSEQIALSAQFQEDSATRGPQATPILPPQSTRITVDWATGLVRLDATEFRLVGYLDLAGMKTERTGAGWKTTGNFSAAGFVKGEPAQLQLAAFSLLRRSDPARASAPSAEELATLEFRGLLGIGTRDGVPVIVTATR